MEKYNERKFLEDTNTWRIKTIERYNQEIDPKSLTTNKTLKFVILFGIV